MRSYLATALRPVAVVLLILLGLVYLGVKVVSAQTAPAPENRFQEGSKNLALTITPETVDGGQIVANDDGQVVWQYVGPENTEELKAQCNSLSWSELEVRARQIEAETQEEDGRIVRASATVDLPDGATNDMHYCFRTPVLIGEEVQHYYHLHTLTLAATPSYGYFIFEESTHLEGTNIPASVSLRPNPEMIAEVQPVGWEYASVNDAEECDEGNTELDFSALGIVVSTAKPRLLLTADMAGQVLCFRLIGQDADGQQVHFYDTYTVPAANLSDDEGGSARAWLIIVGIVAALALASLIIVRSK